MIYNQHVNFWTLLQKQILVSIKINGYSCLWLSNSTFKTPYPIERSTCEDSNINNDKNNWKQPECLSANYICI